MCVSFRSTVVVVCLALGASAQDSASNDELARMKRELQETRSELADSRREIEQLRQGLQELRSQVRPAMQLLVVLPGTPHPLRPTVEC
jgi:septal ring factor EnvC (AmiA/AmiB activator)